MMLVINYDIIRYHSLRKLFVIVCNLNLGLVFQTFFLNPVPMARMKLVYETTE